MKQKLKIHSDIEMAELTPVNTPVSIKTPPKLDETKPEKAEEPVKS